MQTATSGLSENLRYTTIPVQLPSGMSVTRLHSQSCKLTRVLLGYRARLSRPSAHLQQRLHLSSAYHKRDTRCNNTNINPTVRAMATGTSASQDNEFMVVYVTVPNEEVADKLSGSLVSSQLAACVNIMPGVTSVYRWEGKVSRDSELLLIIKTRRSLLDALAAHVKANHLYDVPEVIGLPILGGSPAYLQWLMDSTRQS